MLNQLCKSLGVAVCLALASPAAVSPQMHRGEAGDERLGVAVLLYDGALLLDYGIAAEMFLAADFMRGFHVFTVARTEEVNLSIVGPSRVNFTLDDAPAADVVIVPGGPTWPKESQADATVAYLKRTLDEGGIVYSVCTGSLLLAKAGLLEGRRATTNHAAVKMLKQFSPGTTVDAEAPFVDDGNIVTAAGSATAIPATLHLIERLTSPEIARDLGDRYMDYDAASAPDGRSPR